MYKSSLSDFLSAAVRMYLRRSFNLRPPMRDTLPRSDINAAWSRAYDMPVGDAVDAACAADEEDLGGVGGLLHIVGDDSGLSYNVDDIGALVHRALFTFSLHRDTAASLIAPLSLDALGQPAANGSSPKPTAVLRLRSSADGASEEESSDALSFCLAHHFLWTILS